MKYKGIIDYRWKLRKRWMIGLLIAVCLFGVLLILIRLLHTNIPTYDPGIVLVKLYIVGIFAFSIGYLARALFADNLDATIVKSGPAERRRLISILEESLEVDDIEDRKIGKTV